MEVVRTKHGVLFAATVLGAIVGHSLTIGLGIESRDLDAWRAAKAVYANTIAGAVLGAAIGIAIDLAVNGRPKRGEWRFGLVASLLTFAAAPIFCSGLIAYLIFLRSYP